MHISDISKVTFTKKSKMEIKFETTWYANVLYYLLSTKIVNVILA